MPSVSLKQSNAIIAATLAEGRKRGLKPLCVAILDPGGRLISLQREDGASILRPQLAIGKAAGALALGMSSRKIAELAVERPHFIASLGTIAPDGIVPAAGGVLLASIDGQLIGSVGVTGDTSDNDEVCALAGILAANLKPME